MTPRAIRGLLIAALFAVWLAASGLGWTNPIIIASPWSLVQALLRDFPRFLDALRVTLLEIGASIVIGWTAGVAAGLLAGRFGALSRLAAPILTSMFAVPLIVIYPLLLAWVGIGWPSKILFGVLSGFFPIALNTLTSVQRVDSRFAVMARAMGASEMQIFVRVIARLALPGIVSGLRVGTALTVIGVVVTEMLASTAGLGYLISYHTTLFDTGHVYLGIALALAVVLALNYALGTLEQRLGTWRADQQNAGQAT